MKCVDQPTVFADNLVLCAMTHEEVEEDLETWRVVFERHGLKISRTKTEYLPSTTNDTETTVRIRIRIRIVLFGLITDPGDLC